MAKATITLEDNDDGSVSCRVEFDPAVKTAENGTPAQNHAMALLERSTQIATVVDEPLIDGKPAKLARPRRRR